MSHLVRILGSRPVGHRTRGLMCWTEGTKGQVPPKMRIQSSSPHLRLTRHSPQKKVSGSILVTKQTKKNLMTTTVHLTLYHQEGGDDDWTVSLDVEVCVYILKGNSGRSMKPWWPQSGVWYASGWIMKWAFSPAFFTPSIISFTVFRHVAGSKWQLMPTMWAPVRGDVDFHQLSNDQTSGEFLFGSLFSGVF